MRPSDARGRLSMSEMNFDQWRNETESRSAAQTYKSEVLHAVQTDFTWKRSVNANICSSCRVWWRPCDDVEDDADASLFVLFCSLINDAEMFTCMSGLVLISMQTVRSLIVDVLWCKRCNGATSGSNKHCSSCRCDRVLQHREVFLLFTSQHPAVCLFVLLNSRLSNESPSCYYFNHDDKWSNDQTIPNFDPLNRLLIKQTWLKKVIQAVLSRNKKHFIISRSFWIILN